MVLSLAIGAILAGLQAGGVVWTPPSLRVTNAMFSGVVVILGFLQFCFTFCRWRRWFLYLCGIFNLCLFANGVTWAIDSKNCLSVSGLGHCSTHAAAVTRCCGSCGFLSWIRYAT